MKDIKETITGVTFDDMGNLVAIKGEGKAKDFKP